MLSNVHLSGDSLVADSGSAIATSEIIYQEAEDTDFESVREARARWLLTNQCDASGSTTDRARLNCLISEGDKIVIIDSSNNPIETVATGLQQDLAGLVPAMTSNTEPSGTITGDNINSSYPLYYAFNGSIAANNETFINSYIQYQFANNTPTYVKYFYLNANYAFSTFYKTLTIKGSNDGINFVTIFKKSVNLGVSSPDKAKIWEIFSPGKFSYYRLEGLDRNCYLYGLQFYSSDNLGYSIDTSAVTNGTTPQYVYKFEDKLKFNSTTCTEKDKYIEFGTNGSQLYIQALYNDALISGRVLQTTVEFSAPGNKVLEITGQVYKQP